jgi:hypothetical protein
MPLHGGRPKNVITVFVLQVAHACLGPVDVVMRCVPGIWPSRRSVLSHMPLHGGRPKNVIAVFEIHCGACLPWACRCHDALRARDMAVTASGSCTILCVLMLAYCDSEYHHNSMVSMSPAWRQC